MKVKCIIFFAILARYEQGLADSCGFTSRATGVVQIFSSPNWPQPYENNLQCLWTFSSRPGYRIRVDFVAIDTEDCCDYLEVRESNVELFRLRGQLNISEYFVSTSSEVVFHFYSDESNGGTGFKATFQETTEQPRSNVFCLFNLTVGIGLQTFTSPGWPSAYPNGYYCQWNFTAQRSYRVRVDFIFFDTEFCCDYLAVLENGTEIFRIRGNVTITEPIISSGNRLNFIFFSDDDIAHQGFRAIARETTEERRLDAPCGFVSTATSSEQNLFSPGYPAPYQNDVDCLWNITATENLAIEIAIIFLDVEMCCDILQIHDGSFNESESIDLGKFTTQTYISTNPTVTIRFTSDYTEAGAGFRLSFRAVEPARGRLPPASNQLHTTSTNYQNANACGYGAVASNIPQPFLSPNWPNPYGHNLDSSVAKGKPTQGTGVIPGCTERQLSKSNQPLIFIIKTTIHEDAREVLRFHGDIVFSRPLISRSNRLVLIFHSDDEVTSRGFQAQFRETNEPHEFPFAPCGFDTVAITSNQSLNSPGWPRPYNNNLNCTWTITARHGYRIRVTFVFFITEQYDYVEAYIEETEVFRIKGNQTKPVTFISADEHLLLRFISDESGSQKGFQAVFAETNTERSTEYYAPCGFTAIATTDEQNLFSPSWPEVYENNLDCEWTITSSLNSPILLRFTSFNTELCCDYLDILEGEKLKLRLAGDITLNEPITSSGNTMTLRFHSDASVSDHGFQAVFLVLDEGLHR